MHAQIVIDHNCWDISVIPDSVITKVKNELKIFYVHKSHGEQLVVDGTNQVSSILGTKFKTSAAWGLPSDNTALNVSNRASYGPQDYWLVNETANGMQNTINELDANPSINVTGFMWCSDLDYATEDFVNQYLNNMAALEELYSGKAGAKRKVRFIYFTSNKNKNPWDPSVDYNKHLRNEQIRHWVVDHPEKDRVLFDFADMDCYWFNSATGLWETATETYNSGSGSISVPVIMDRYSQEIQDHTTWENIEHKGRAFWWMCARLVGWNYDKTAMPVELTSFSAEKQEMGILLKWETATEQNNAGFFIERMVNSIDQVRSNKWEELGFVQGSGSSNISHSYSFIDKNISLSGKYVYRLKQIDNDGKVNYKKETEIDICNSNSFVLNQNYPNPFNPSTVISFTLPEPSFVTVKVFDSLGRVISILCNEEKIAGSYNLDFSGHGLTSGIYYYTVQAGQKVLSKKMHYLK
jgi:hypothetical protein